MWTLSLPVALGTLTAISDLFCKSSGIVDLSAYDKDAW